MSKLNTYIDRFLNWRSYLALMAITFFIIPLFPSMQAYAPGFLLRIGFSLIAPGVLILTVWVLGSSLVATGLILSDMVSDIGSTKKGLIGIGLFILIIAAISISLAEAEDHDPYEAQRELMVDPRF